MSDPTAGFQLSSACSRCFRIIRMMQLLLLLLSGTAGVFPQSMRAAGKTIIVRNASHNLEEFLPYAELAERLKSYGQVQVEISALADKSWYEIPEGGSPWHEYACYVPAPWKFYPHPKIAPHIPAEWVEKNRKLLLAKAAVVRKLGLGAVIKAKNSHFLPEAFFQQNPGLRGPRVDHPRRSRKEAFSMCVDLPETREMIEWMMAELKRNVAGLRTVITGTNDAGAGICWAAAQYPGPNGPRHCSHINAGERVRDLSLTVHRGAVNGGGDVVLFWSNVNFWRNELEVVRPLLPPDTYLSRYDSSIMQVGTLINQTYPFLGLFDPMTVIAAMERYHKPGTKTLIVNWTPWYARTQQPPETVSRFLDLVEDCIKKPTGDLSGRLEKLKEFAARWGGEGNSGKVFEAFYRMHKAFELKNGVTPGYAGYSNLYCGVSMRHLTRPLVIKPELLTPEEEAYFLPYVFNPSENEGRMDYIDFHGGRMFGTPHWNSGGLSRALGEAIGAAELLEGLESAPEGEWLGKVALSLRMWVSEVRSIHNFYHAQLIRDRNAEILAGEPRIPEKVDTWDGDEGNLEWNEIMRDEFDNTNELIALLERGGLELVAKAKEPRYEDTFLPGPDLIDQLRKKTRIMREHWLDVQDYLAPPHK